MPQHLKCLATVIYDLSLLTIPVSNCHLFSDINISQGSVATRLRCGGILSYHFTANLSPSLTMKDFWKSVHIWQSYRHEFGGPLILEHSVVMSDFRLEVEVRQFRACALKNMQYNPYLWPNLQKNLRLTGNQGQGTRRWI